MASTSCFLHHHALTNTARTPSQRHVPALIKPNQIVCRAQKQAAQEDDGTSVMSRRLALTVLIGAAAIGSKVSPADAAYGEAGNYLYPYTYICTLFVNDSSSNQIITYQGPFHCLNNIYLGHFNSSPKDHTESFIENCLEEVSHIFWDYVFSL